MYREAYDVLQTAKSMQGKEHQGNRQAIHKRMVDVDKLFTHRWKLDQANEAYQQFDKQSDGKGVFLM